MPDPTKLLELPLYALITLVFFYILLEMIKWALEQRKHRQEEIRARAYLDYYVSFNHGAHMAAYLHIEAMLQDLSDDLTSGKATEETKVRDGSFWFPKEVDVITLKRKKQPDFSTSDSHIEATRITKNLLKFDNEEAGLALFFLEQTSLFYAEIDEWNIVNDEGLTYKQAANQLRSLRNVLIPALLVGQAIQSNEKRQTKQDRVLIDQVKSVLFENTGKNTRLEKDQALLELFRSEIYRADDINRIREMNYSAEDKDPKSTQAIGALIENAFSFPIEAFDVMRVKPEKNGSAWLLLPGGLFLAFIGFAYVNEDYHNSVIGKGKPQVSCKSYYDSAGDLTSTECTQVFDTFDVELKDNIVVKKTEEDN